MANVACIAERSVCAIRATRLDDDCTPLTGPTDGAVALAIATINATAEVQEGTAFEPVDGCGRTVYSARNPDVVRRKNITMELHLQDFELIELLTDSSLILGAADGPWPGLVIGINEPGANTESKPGVALEIWTKTAFGTGDCGEDSETENPVWMRHTLPKVKLRLGDRTFEDAHATVSFSGFAVANPLWGEGGPWGDWPAEGPLDPSTPHARMFDPLGPPEANCGYLTPSAGS